jgi:RNA 2',3'-cyclic 3'-phosphodiesterase
MRLFTAVELDTAVREAAALATAQIRDAVQRAAPRLTARWVPAEHLHLTVRFLGDVRGERAESVISALGTPLDLPAFDLTLAGCGVFPRSGPPRVLWIGVSDGHRGMADLHVATGARLTPLGFEAERRPYTAHLTIARVKETGRVTAGMLGARLSAVPADCGSFRVSALTLFRSRLSPRGAVYEPLLRVPLGSAPGQ